MWDYVYFISKDYNRRRIEFVFHKSGAQSQDARLSCYSGPGWQVVHFGVSPYLSNFLPSQRAISILSDRAVFKH